jgi:hypothetical protein
MIIELINLLLSAIDGDRSRFIPGPVRRRYSGIFGEFREYFENLNRLS